MPKIRYNQIADLDLITSAEIGAGYKTEVLNPDEYPLTVTSTGTNTIDITGADLTNLFIEEDDIARIAGGAAEGDYRVNSVIDSNTLEVKEDVPNASTGDLTLYHKPGAERVGVDSTDFVELYGSTVQDVLEDIEAKIHRSAVVHRMPVIIAGDNAGDDTGWSTIGRFRFADEDLLADDQVIRFKAEVELFEDGLGEVALYDVTDETSASVLIDPIWHVVNAGVNTIDLEIPPSGTPATDRIFELRAQSDASAGFCQILDAYVQANLRLSPYNFSGVTTLWDARKEDGADGTNERSWEDEIQDIALSTGFGTHKIRHRDAQPYRYIDAGADTGGGMKASGTQGTFNYLHDGTGCAVFFTARVNLSLLENGFVAANCLGNGDVGFQIATVNNGGQAVFRYSVFNGTTHVTIATPNGFIPDSNWHAYAIFVSDTEMFFYRDGSLEYSDTYSISHSGANATSDFKAFSRPNNSGVWNWELADMVIKNELGTIEEVKAHTEWGL